MKTAEKAGQQQESNSANQTLTPAKASDPPNRPHRAVQTKNDLANQTSGIKMSHARTTIPTEKLRGNPKITICKTRQHPETTGHNSTTKQKKSAKHPPGMAFANTQHRDNMALRPCEKTRQTTFCLSAQADSIIPFLAKDPRWRPWILCSFPPRALSPSVLLKKCSDLTGLTLYYLSLTMASGTDIVHRSI